MIAKATIALFSNGVAKKKKMTTLCRQVFLWLCCNEEGNSAFFLCLRRRR